nr:zinc finger, C6HC-type [Tanacetum cinerariifolium]
MVTRSQSGIVKPLECFSLHTASISPIPKTPFVALQNSHWRQAMLDEYNALIKNGTWILVPKPVGVNMVQTGHIRVLHVPSRYQYADIFTKGLPTALFEDFCSSLSCKVTWHSGMDCSEFQSLKENERDPNDIMLMDLAKNKKWRRCSSCKYNVERTDGCLHITCRCGYHFCYGCGEKHTSSHACALMIA